MERLVDVVAVAAVVGAEEEAVEAAVAAVAVAVVAPALAAALWSASPPGPRGGGWQQEGWNERMQGPAQATSDPPLAPLPLAPLSSPPPPTPTPLVPWTPPGRSQALQMPASQLTPPR